MLLRVYIYANLDFCTQLAALGIVLGAGTIGSGVASAMFPEFAPFIAVSPYR